MATATLPSPAGSPLLHAAGLRKSFGALAAVDDLSFDVCPGQIFGIAGPNGSGKSTLFNILTAIPFRPDAGQVIFAGRSLAGMSPHRIARSGLVRSFQKDATFDTLSARQTVGVPGYHGSATGSVATAEIE